jgi:hypothetical protein
MCFGPTSSFAIGTVLSSVSIGCLIYTSDKRRILFAVIPLLFAIQQFSEGGLWIIQIDPRYGAWRDMLTMIFLVIAFLWPIIVPVSISLLEIKGSVQKLMKGFIAVGMLLSAYLLYFVFFKETLATLANGRINYQIQSPGSGIAEGVIYALVITGPMFLSSHLGIVILGIVNVVLISTAAFMWKNEFISVWCFFAAMLSALIFLFIYSQKHVKREFALSS